MLQAILSDIHSNLEALQTCVRHAREHGAERFVCLGDCVGYGADPERTLDLLMSLPGILLVRGNHDDALFQGGDYGGSSIREAINWTARLLTARQKKFLDSAPYMHRENPVTYAHASAHEPHAWEYLSQPGQIEQCMDAADTPVTFIGHVHVPKVFYRTQPDGEVRELNPVSGIPIPLSQLCSYVINVGSVGQPRDGNNASCYVLHDTTRQEVTFFRLAYDHLTTADKIRNAGLAPRFAERLSEGR